MSRRKPALHDPELESTASSDGGLDDRPEGHSRRSNEGGMSAGRHQSARDVTPLEMQRLAQLEMQEELTNDEVAEKRRIKNRMAARRLRNKKNATVSLLSNEVEQLKAERQEALQQVAALQRRCCDLEASNLHLKTALLHRLGADAAAGNIPAEAAAAAAAATLAAVTPPFPKACVQQQAQQQQQAEGSQPPRKRKLVAAEAPAGEDAGSALAAAAQAADAPQLLLRGVPAGLPAIKTEPAGAASVAAEAAAAQAVAQQVARARRLSEHGASPRIDAAAAEAAHAKAGATAAVPAALAAAQLAAMQRLCSGAPSPQQQVPGGETAGQQALPLFGARSQQQQAAALQQQLAAAQQVAALQQQLALQQIAAGRVSPAAGRSPCMPSSPKAGSPAAAAAAAAALQQAAAQQLGAGCQQFREPWRSMCTQAAHSGAAAGMQYGTQMLAYLQQQLGASGLPEMLSMPYAACLASQPAAWPAAALGLQPPAGGGPGGLLPPGLAAAAAQLPGGGAAGQPPSPRWLQMLGALASGTGGQQSHSPRCAGGSPLPEGVLPGIPYQNGASNAGAVAAAQLQPTATGLQMPPPAAGLRPPSTPGARIVPNSAFLAPLPGTGAGDSMVDAPGPGAAALMMRRASTRLSGTLPKIHNGGSPAPSPGHQAPQACVDELLGAPDQPAPDAAATSPAAEVPAPAPARGSTSGTAGADQAAATAAVGGIAARAATGAVAAKQAAGAPAATAAGVMGAVAAAAEPPMMGLAGRCSPLGPGVGAAGRQQAA